MRRLAVIAALSLFLGASGAWGQTQIRIDDGTGIENQEPDQGKEKACRCCEECMAAMKSTKGKEEGRPKTNACRECCERCGKVKKPLDKEFPPEVVK